MRAGPPTPPPGPKAVLEGADLARACARMASSRRATDVTILDLRRLSAVTSFFVLGTGTSKRQIQGIADEIVKKVKASGLIPFGVEGRQDARWVLIDLGDVVVHLMSADARSFYDLEMLWGDAAALEWE